MWVFGDRELAMDAALSVEAMAGSWRRIGRAAPGIARHGELVSLLVELGMLAQGLADDGNGEGPRDPVASLLRAGTRVARAIDASRGTRGGEGALGAPVELGAPIELDALVASRSLRGTTVPARVPEGYAFYALYPELYLDAARRFAARHGRRALVVGVRSIGTSLACCASAALERLLGPFTIRPSGDPFAREATLPPGLARAARHARAPVLVVDEGPGLSGSSLASVADALESAGVVSPRIHFLPSHDGSLGPHAGPAQRARWERTPKHVVRFEEAILGPRSPWPLARWFEPFVGAADGPLEDLSGGAWRARLFTDGRAYPPAHVTLERRKYLLRARGAQYLLKFSGIGPFAVEHEARARGLGSTGLVPSVVARAHGFLATHWAEGVPLAACDFPTSERATGLARYIAVVASQPRHARPGASPEILLRMAARNVGLALGDERARALGRYRGLVARASSEARPIAVDGRLHAWEWLVTPDGALVKTDAFDHHAAHDLVGPQDLAWDVAGGLVELARTDDERSRILDALARRGVRVAPPLLAFYEAAYLAFQLGAATIAADTLATSAPADAARFRSESRRYAARVARLLDAPLP